MSREIYDPNRFYERVAAECDANPEADPLELNVRNGDLLDHELRQAVESVKKNLGRNIVMEQGGPDPEEYGEVYLTQKEEAGILARADKLNAVPDLREGDELLRMQSGELIGEYLKRHYS